MWQRWPTKRFIFIDSRQEWLERECYRSSAESGRAQSIKPLWSCDQRSEGSVRDESNIEYNPPFSTAPIFPAVCCDVGYRAQAIYGLLRSQGLREAYEILEAWTDSEGDD